MIFFLCKEFLSYVRTQPFTLLLFSLENASNAVRRATENLVKAAQESIKNEDEDELTIDASDGSVKAQAKVSIFFTVRFKNHGLYTTLGIFLFQHVKGVDKIDYYHKVLQA